MSGSVYFTYLIVLLQISVVLTSLYMGNLCSSGQATVARRATVPKEPPLATAPSMSQEDLDHRVERMLQLQQLVFQNALQGKHLAEQALAERRKATSLLTSIAEKTKHFANSEDKSPPALSEIEELQQAISHIENSALSRSEDQVTAYMRSIDQLETEIAENWEALKDVSAAKSLPRETSLKLRECEQAMKKITTYFLVKKDSIKRLLII